MQHAQFQEDVKVGKLVGDLVVSERVGEEGGFGVPLAARVFVEVVESGCAVLR